MYIWKFRYLNINLMADSMTRNNFTCITLTKHTLQKVDLFSFFFLGGEGVLGGWERLNQKVKKGITQHTPSLCCQVYFGVL